MRKTRRLAYLLCAAALLAGPAAQSAPGGPPPQEAASPQAADLWRQIFERDLDHLTQLVQSRYIYAVYPADAAWNTQFQASVAKAKQEAALVRDFPSYRAVLQHFVVSFEDAHFSAYFNVASRRVRWPGFAAKYRGGDYVVTTSTVPDARPGEVIASCDGEPLNSWMDRLAPYYGGPPGRETTRAAVANQLFVGRGNPLYALPGTCQIGGRDVALKWRPAPSAGDGPIELEPERTSSSAPTISDSSVSTSDFGDKGAWVRIGTMMPSTPQLVDQYNQLYDRAPSLRDKDFVVIDVRGNPGGSYNWFMAFLRAFYGPAYADYYATARLEIGNTMLEFGDAKANALPSDFTVQKMPADPPMEGKAAPPRILQLPNGARLVFNPPAIDSIQRPSKPPPSLVKAKVYLLTDYGCASACLSFTDEIRRFPGVIQIGAETHIDRRSGGWPEAYQLPSGLALVRMGRMVREHRARGENEAWTPQIRFTGDIADTAAVKTWVLDEVVTRASTTEKASGVAKAKP